MQTKENQHRRYCIFSILTLVCACLLGVAMALMVHLRLHVPYDSVTLYLLSFAIPAAFALISLWRLESNSHLKGRLLTYPALLIVVLLFAVAPGLSLFAPPRAYGVMCGATEKGLSQALSAYATEHAGLLPDPARWCDLIEDRVAAHRHPFRCPKAPQDVRSTYALNSAADPNLKDNPPDMVLVFESKPGWNLSGGPEFLDPSHHNGCSILFADMHVELIRADKLKSLRWSADPNSLPVTRQSSESVRI